MFELPTPKSLRTAALLGSTIALSGCAPSQYGESRSSLCDSEMLRMGPDTYMAESGCGPDREIRHAGIYCDRRNLEVLIERVEPSPHSNVIFKCLSQDDPRLESPTYGREPDVQVDVR